MRFVTTYKRELLEEGKVMSVSDGNVSDFFTDSKLTAIIFQVVLCL